MQDYHGYERTLCERIMLPLFARLGLDLAGTAVLDAGCGHGGVIAALSDTFRLRRAVGLDRDEGMLENARRRAGSGVTWVAGDLLACRDGPFDIIILRDVLEHIVDVEAALRRCHALLRAGGRLYLTVAPFLSPFGGHQHNGSGPLAWMPWAQLLPESLFRRGLGVRGNGYKERRALAEDIESVLATRLTLAGLRRALDGFPWKAEHECRFLFRPDYRIKFGLPALALPRAIPPAMAELCCTGAEMLLRKAPEAGAGR